MKAFIVLSTLVLSVIAEAPIDRSYLPPSSEYGAPSPASLRAQYGAPADSAISTQYGVPSANSLSTQYGAPGLRGATAGRSSQRPAARVSSSFGTTSSRRLGAGRRFGAGLSTQYGTPSAAGRSAAFGGIGLSTQYGAPSYSGGALSTQYGAPLAGSGFGRGSGLSSVYGVPGYGYGRSGSQEDALAEPANYQFSYSVEDTSSLSDFGHDEVRQDESAQGEYRVLLPDGRKQIVSYEADENGYRPNIQYEDTGITAYSTGGYNYGRGGNGAGAGNGGYHY